jgi:hypothetical protein
MTFATPCLAVAGAILLNHNWPHAQRAFVRFVLGFAFVLPAGARGKMRLYSAIAVMFTTLQKRLMSSLRVKSSSSMSKIKKNPYLLK